MRLTRRELCVRRNSVARVERDSMLPPHSITSSPDGVPAVTPLVVRSDGPSPVTAAGSGGDNQALAMRPVPANGECG